jgi:dienelactone hydrolase
MSPKEALQERVDGCRQEMAWQRGTVEEMRAWQTRLRQRLAAATGLDRLQPGKPGFEVVRTHPGDGYTHEEIVFEARPSCIVNAHLLLPIRLTEPRPAVLCLPGHGVGVDAIVGLREEPYHADFALQCVRHGFPTLAIEQCSFGKRRTNDRENSCHQDSTTALMLGETVTGWRVFDAMRALDLLEGLPGVDANRLATMGISGGGLTSLWTAALDERVHTAVVSGYFNTFRDSILSVDHCVDNFVPGVLRLCEMPDFAGLIAPRRLFVESGTRDELFPVEAFRRAVARAREIYAAFDVPERFRFEEFEGDHRFHGVEAFKFLQHGANPAIDIERSNFVGP